MPTIPHQTQRLIHTTVFCYRILLYLYPRAFRRRFGRQMGDAFEDRCHASVRSGASLPTLSGLLIRAFGEVVFNSLMERFSTRRKRRDVHDVGSERMVFGQAVSGLLGSFFQDARFAARTLRRRPLFTAIAIGTLAIGIGGATVIYSIADTVLLQRLPYPELDRLVSVWTTRPNWRGREGLDRRWDRVHMHYGEYLRWQEGTSLFDAVALYKSYGFEMASSGGDETEFLKAGLATASLQDVLGFRPTIGRWFLPGEDGPDAEHVVLLGHGLWRSRFASDPNVLGSTVSLNGEPYTVIGVAPPQLRLRMTIDWASPRGFGLWRARDEAVKEIWAPVGVHDDLEDSVNYEGIGRLSRGASVDQAIAETAPLIRGTAPPERRGVRIMPRSVVETGGMGSQVLLLAVPSILLLIIALSNITTLLLGEAVGRQPEIRTRTALGAGKGRLIRQLMTESTLLGFLGSAFGSLLAIIGTRVLVAMAPAASPMAGIEVSWGVLLFASGVGVGGGILFGVAPAISSGGGIGQLTQRVGSRTSSPRSGVVQSGIVAFQVALTSILLVGSGLFIRTLSSLLSVDLGFDKEDLAFVSYGADSPLSGTLDRLLEEIAALPGIESVGAIQSPPMESEGDWDIDYETGGAGRGEGIRVNRRFVSAGYHETMKIHLLAGRFLTPRDNLDNQPVAVVSETMARRFWPDGPAVGENIRGLTYLGEPDGPWTTVVGVVSDVRHHGFTEAYVPTVYLPNAQRGQEEPNGSTLIARVGIGASSALPLIRSVIESLPGDITVRNATTMETVVSRKAIDQRYRALLMMAFGMIAVVLAAGGVFGVVARRVAMRRRDIGIRMALGAKEGLLIRGVLGATVGQAVVGVSAGLVVAFLGRSFVTAFLFGVSPADPATYFTVGTSLLLVCLFASFVPAYRITAVDPGEALREE